MMGDRHGYRRFSLALIPEDTCVDDYKTGFEIFDDLLDEYGR